jgi:hypothetical protein
MNGKMSNVDKLLRAVQLRRDCAEARIGGSAGQPFVCARFNHERGVSPWIILQPRETTDGWLFRVFIPFVERLPSGVRVNRLCAVLTSRLRVGIFILLKSPQALVAYAAQQFTDESLPSDSVLDRLIREAVAATRLYERVACRLATHLEGLPASMLRKLRTGNPTLN